MVDKNKIFIELDEEIHSVVDKISKCSGKDIILVIPQEALVLRSIINLKILKKRAEEMDKNISILKTNKSKILNQDKDKAISSIVTDHNETLNLNSDFDIVAEKKNLYRNENLQRENQEKKVKMFDIVKKVKSPEIDIDNTLKATKRESDVYELHKRNERTIDNSDTVEKNNNNKKRRIKRRKKTTVVSSLSSKILVLFILIIITIVSIAAFFMFQKADVNIVLKKELASYNFEFTADENVEENDTNNKKIPLDIIKIDTEESKTYPTTGKKHIKEKANGKITVFNEFSSAPQRLLASTRFLSKSGKLFRIKQSVTIPGFSRVEGVDVPGQITVTVYADNPGEEYNISPTSFTLPALQEQKSPKYQFVYARSVKAMTGGMDQEVNFFSEKDYAKAKNELIPIVKEKNKKDFSSKISDEVIVLSKIKEENDDNINIDTDIKIGEVADNFEITVSLQSRILTISKDNLNKMLDEKINEKLEKNKIILKNSRNYEIGELSVITEERVIVPVGVEQYIVTEINIDKLKEEIANKNRKELTTYFNNISGIKSTSISLEPKWIEKIPSAYDKINITIDINNSM